MEEFKELRDQRTVKGSPQYTGKDSVDEFKKFSKKKGSVDSFKKLAEKKPNVTSFKELNKKKGDVDTFKKVAATATAKEASKKVDSYKDMPTKTYKIKSGDTLSQIAKSKGTTVAALMAANPQIKNADKIRAGATIKMPSSTASPKNKPTPKKKPMPKNKDDFKSDADFNKRIKKVLGLQDGGMIGASDMSAKKTSSPKKKQMPQYYMGGGMAKKSKMYSYGGRVAKYKD